MKIKQSPTGFVATCQCGEVVGALDFLRTDRRDAGRILSQWIADGCTVSPRFERSWSVMVMSCQCERAAA